MSSARTSKTRAVALLLCLLAGSPAYAGVSRAIQEKYRRTYENKALYLRIAVFAERLNVFISGNDIRFDSAVGSGSARFKVGDQVRILALDFGGEEIKFRVSSISSALAAEIVYRFDSSLQENFPNSAVFDRALQLTFTEGLKYTDIDEAKKAFTEEQFERSIKEIAASGGTNRETVLRIIAPHLPSYQEVVKDAENLKGRNQELSAQLSQSQAENRKLEADLRTQQAEAARLKNQATALQEKIDSSTAQLSRLGDDLRSARGTTEGYQRELANLQRSLRLKVDPARDLGAQITELGAAMRKVQKDYETLEGQSATLRTSLANAESRAAMLKAEVEDLKASNAQLRETIGTLTSKEDSLARQFIELKQVKEQLDSIVRAFGSLDSRVVEQTSASGVLRVKARFYLRSVPLGTLDFVVPERIGPNETVAAEASFTSESIDYVRVSPEERQQLRSLGDRLKMTIQLSSQNPSLAVRADRDAATHEIGERDHATWHWNLSNKGAQDGWVRLDVQLVNRNAAVIPVFRFDQAVASASVVRQIRNYLQPVPLAAGAVLGMILAAIARLLLRPTSRRVPRPPASPRPSATAGTKQL